MGLRARFGGHYQPTMDVVRKIRAAVADGGIRKTELADEAGVNRKALDDVHSDEWNPQLKTLLALGDAVDRIMTRRAHAVQGAATDQAAA